MKNLKPSKLPEGTVIDDERRGEYIKRADGVWEEMDRDYLGDRERVSDVGYDTWLNENMTELGLTNRIKSDDYFTEYKVIASDPSFIFHMVKLHGPWSVERQLYSDSTPAHHCKGYNCEVELDVQTSHKTDLIATIKQLGI